MGLLSAQTVKKVKFQNPGWRTAGIVKTVKSLYHNNGLNAKFGVIMQIGPFIGDTAKISNF